MKAIYKQKYNAQQTKIDGIKFDSKAEARRYKDLQILQKSKKIKWFIRQVPFDLPGNIKYRCDFLVVDQNDNIIIEDVKGFETEVFKLKKKLFEEKYPLKISIIKYKRKQKLL